MPSPLPTTVSIDTSQPATSPPPAPAPVQSSPGPRAAAFQRLFADALGHTLKTCSYANFASCFPTPAKYEPEALQGLWRDFIARLGDVCQSNFDAVLVDRNVVPSLNELDSLFAKAKKRKAQALAAGQTAPPTPPHTLPPQPLLQTHLSPFLLNAQSTLSTQLTETQSANAVLLSEIQSQRTEIESLLVGLESVFADLEGGARALADEEGGVKGLDGESKAIDEELMGLR